MGGRQEDHHYQPGKDEPDSQISLIDLQNLITAEIDRANGLT
jgi:hypothetical protein